MHSELLVKTSGSVTCDTTHGASRTVPEASTRERIAAEDLRSTADSRSSGPKPSPTRYNPDASLISYTPAFRHAIVCRSWNRMSGTPANPPSMVPTEVNPRRCDHHQHSTNPSPLVPLLEVVPRR